MLDAFGFVAKRGDSSLYRSAAPNDHAGLETLEQLGIRKVYRLIGSPVEASGDLRQYGLDVEYLRFDIAGVSARGIISVANRIMASLREGVTINVCCRQGRARTGLVVAVWRLLFDGWNIEDVERERAQFGCGWNRSSDEAAIRSILNEVDGASDTGRKGRQSGIVVRGLKHA